MGGKQLKYIQTNYRWATVTTVIDQLEKTQDQKQTCDSSLIALIKGDLETKRSKYIDSFSIAKQQCNDIHLVNMTLVLVFEFNKAKLINK